MTDGRQNFSIASPASLRFSPEVQPLIGGFYYNGVELSESNPLPPRYCEYYYEVYVVLIEYFF